MVDAALGQRRILTYVGNGPYCYANFASMLLESAGESVEPRLIEVLSGVGLGAFWIPESQTLFLSGWASAPDVGVSRSFGLLGFEVAEDAELDGDPMPVEALNLQLSEGPVMPQIHHLMERSRCRARFRGLSEHQMPMCGANRCCPGTQWCTCQVVGGY